MRAAQTIQCEVRTKAGEVTCVVNVVATGNDDGAVAVMRDVVSHVMRAARFDGRAVASPEKRLPDDVIAGEMVVSEPGAAMTVTRIQLSDEARQRLGVTAPAVLPTPIPLRMGVTYLLHGDANGCIAVDEAGVATDDGMRDPRE